MNNNTDFNNLGKQIFADLYGCGVSLDSLDFVKQKMEEAAIRSNATIVQSVFHHFSPYGISGVVVIAESHLAIHTWPESHYAAIDIFTCGDKVDPWNTFNYIKEYLKPAYYNIQDVYRGNYSMIKKYYKNKMFSINEKL